MEPIAFRLIYEGTLILVNSLLSMFKSNYKVFLLGISLIILFLISKGLKKNNSFIVTGGIIILQTIWGETVTNAVKEVLEAERENQNQNE